ncbi:MAG: hypothetical protein LC633_09005 [Desulfobulbaceae bacterium]|nr:hypothetical protein [Desulfobulbaceae bacterium]
MGLVEYNPENPRTMEEMLAEADARMYKAKQKKKK